MIAHTENETTVKVGECMATVIADSVYSTRITTLELVYPRYIHSELMTHRMFSRNASSSRATPLSVTLSEVESDPVFFDFVGKNKSGMVAAESLDNDELVEFREEWEKLGGMVATRVQNWATRFNIHKQTLNRALEPWLRIKTLVTATEWQNFFHLRLAPDAQPEMQSLAKAIKGAMEKSKPAYRREHIPYCEDMQCTSERGQLDWNCFKVCTARCARVSYARLNGRENSLQSDIELHDRLLKSGHYSPFEHAAMVGNGKFANFNGWFSYRYYLAK